VKNISLKFNKKLARVLIGVFVLAICALAIVCVGYSWSYRGKVLPKTQFSNSQLLEGKDLEQLKNYLSQEAKTAQEQKIKAVKDDKNWEMSLEDFGWKVDIDKTANRIFAYGHSGGFINRASDLLRSLVSKKGFEPVVEFNQRSAEDWFVKINDEVGTPKQEANIAVKDGQARVIDPSAGKSIDEFPAQQALMNRFLLKNLDMIQIKIIDDLPTITKSEAEGLQDKAVELTSKNVKLNGPNGSVTLNTKTVGSMIELKKPTKKSFLSRQKALGDAYVSFDFDKIKSFLERNSEDLNIPPKDAKFSISNGKVTITEPSSEGEVIIVDEATNNVISILEKGQDKELKLPAKREQASITASVASDIEKYGLNELVGTATTSFAKSPQNRIHNITTGVQYISGALVKPGDEFSTIGKLGSIDASTGYLPELVIKENETIPEFGGGLCQVSTTLFRAAMNSGLEITERQNHSYRVSYYEPPVGMDATIYSPKPDFKFKNTTDHYILIQGKVVGTKITFDIYGTKDGRTVNITDPVVYDVVPPAPDIYTEDPTMAPGEVKQLDHGHPGAKATFDYTVTKDGKVINRQTFKSAYVAWAAKFVRGPQVDQPAPEASPTN